ncbi:MAG: HAMP domain-containing sensor histidine kinase, partial [Pseudomonadota bacterium]
MSINSFALVIGSVIGGIGALTVMLSGGLIGIWLGAGILTTLIVLQTISLLSPTRPVQSDPLETELKINGGLNALVAVDDPILILSVSSQGRIRGHSGRSNLIPGMKTGRILEDLLPELSESPTSVMSFSAGKFSVLRLPNSTGELVLFLPATASENGTSDEVQERTQFFASLGHDLKSPLNGIIGFADIMDAEIRGPMPEAYKDYPSLIRESGDTLMRLIEDILGYAKAEAGTYELDIAPLDIAASGDSVFRQSNGIAELSGVNLKLKSDGEVMALADAGAVRRIWDNLVSNAIKYSSRGDTVALHAFEKNGLCVLSVRDTGAGMDADDLARIAKPFAQGRNAKGRAGTGLGLAMVQRLTELQ